MNLVPNKLSKKALLTVTSIGLAGVLVGSGATYLIVRDDLNRNAPPLQTRNTGNAPPSPFVLETTLPQGTISPTAIVAKPTEYNGKEVKIRGRIVETAPDKYIIVGQETSGGAAITLDVRTAKIDVTPYISGYSDPKKSVPADSSSGNSPKAIPPVTITGIFTVESQGVKVTASKLEL